ncbi:hypothetical protein XENOCAPTIV_029888, partial [Xenoophorus captivus]
VNLKEQGQLIRQDEFTVFFRKKKCVRRVFLFEHLILFSKPKRTDFGNDVYVYKQSFKTNDIGMTHNSGVSGLCFEICCLSALSAEVVDDSSPMSQRSEQKLIVGRAASLRKNSPPAVTRKKPGVPPKPPHLAKPQVKMKV